MRAISSSWVFIFWPERIRDRGRKCYIAVYTCRLDQPSAFSTVKEIGLRIRFLRKFVIITDVILTHPHDHCARKQVSRFSSSSVSRRRSQQLSTSIGLQPSSCSSPCFQIQIHQHDNVRLKLISRNAMYLATWFFFNGTILARTPKQGERAKPTCAVYASKAYKSTRVAAVSWPTITELTPTVALRRLFTWATV